MRNLGSLLLFLLLMCAIRALSADYSWNELSQMKSDVEKSEISGSARKHHVNVEQKHSADGVTCPDCEDGSVCCRRGVRFACCLSIFNLTYKIGSTKFHEQIEVNVADNTATEYFDDGRILTVDFNEGIGAMYVPEKKACYMLPGIKLGDMTDAQKAIDQLSSGLSDRATDMGAVVYKLVDVGDPISDHSVLPLNLQETCSNLKLYSAVRKTDTKGGRKSSVHSEFLDFHQPRDTIESRDPSENDIDPSELELSYKDLKDVNECSTNPCKNDGVCYHNPKHYVCVCLPGFEGAQCQTNINECVSNPCRNGATCVDGVNSYTCRCSVGFTGTFCQINIDECESDPCLNDGVCIDQVNSFVCQCSHGYSGKLCQADINECGSSPCQHGQCFNGVGRYACACAPGYAGLQCQTNINECASNPCRNGGTCVDNVNSYKCFCKSLYTGILCETKCGDPGGMWGWGGYNNC